MWKAIFTTVFYFITAPRKGWMKKREENHPDFLNQYLFPFFGLIAVTTFIGSMWLTETADIRRALKQTIVVVSALFGGFYAAAYLLNALFPKFELPKNEEAAQRFAGYASAALYLLFFVMPLLPQFPVLWVAALYTLYIVYAGTDVFLGVEKNKTTGFTVMASLLIVLVPLLIKILLELLIKQTA